MGAPRCAGSPLRAPRAREGRGSVHQLAVLSETPSSPPREERRPPGRRDWGLGTGGVGAVEPEAERAEEAEAEAEAVAVAVAVAVARRAAEVGEAQGGRQGVNPDPGQSLEEPAGWGPRRPVARLKRPVPRQRPSRGR